MPDGDGHSGRGIAQLWRAWHRGRLPLLGSSANSSGTGWQRFFSLSTSKGLWLADEDAISSQPIVSGTLKGRLAVSTKIGISPASTGGENSGEKYLFMTLKRHNSDPIPTILDTRIDALPKVVTAKHPSQHTASRNSSPENADFGRQNTWRMPAKHKNANTVPLNAKKAKTKKANVKTWTYFRLANPTTKLTNIFTASYRLSIDNKTNKQRAARAAYGRAHSASTLSSAIWFNARAADGWHLAPRACTRWRLARRHGIAQLKSSDCNLGRRRKPSWESHRNKEKKDPILSCLLPFGIPDILCRFLPHLCPSACLSHAALPTTPPHHLSITFIGTWGQATTCNLCKACGIAWRDKPGRRICRTRYQTRASKISLWRNPSVQAGRKRDDTWKKKNLSGQNSAH